MAHLSLLLIAVLFAVARVVEPLACPTCLPDSTCPIKNCTEEQNQCMKIQVDQSLEIGHIKTSGSSQSCAVAAKNVNSTFRFDFGESTFLYFSSVLCNETCDLKVDGVLLDNYWNGKVCPKCYKPGYSSCEDNGTVSCQGDFTQCAEISGIIRQDDFEIPFAAKGCAKGDMEELSSKLPMSLVTYPYNYTLATLSHRAANGALAAMRRVVFSLNRKDLVPQAVFFFPCFLGLFAVKILS